MGWNPWKEGKDFLTGAWNDWTGKSNTEANIQQQREFAQKGIRWRVSDAKKAGIHPLFALGANTASFSPVAGPDYGGAVGDVMSAANFMTGRRDAKAAEALAKLEFEQGIKESDARIRNSDAQARYYDRLGPLPGSGLDAGGNVNNGKDALPSSVPDSDYSRMQNELGDETSEILQVLNFVRKMQVNPQMKADIDGEVRKWFTDTYGNSYRETPHYKFYEWLMKDRPYKPRGRQGR